MNLSQAIEAARNVMRFQHKSHKTEKTYIGWIKRYAAWCKTHPGGSHEDKVRAFLTHLAVDRNVSASTQEQAKNAVVFLYRNVIDGGIGDFSGFRGARIPKRLPTVLSSDEVAALLDHLSGMHWMIAALLYGAGLRLAEALSLRIKDVDFSRHIIMVRDGKGAKDLRQRAHGAVRPIAFRSLALYSSTVGW